MHVCASWAISSKHGHKRTYIDHPSFSVTFVAGLSVLTSETRAAFASVSTGTKPHLNRTFLRNVCRLMVTRAVAFQCAPTSAYKKTRLNVCKSSGGKVPRAPHRPSASHNAGSFPREDRLLDKDNFSQSPQRKLESGWFCR